MTSQTPALSKIRSSKPVPPEIRRLVVKAVVEQDMSCRAAAKVYDISYSSAIRFVDRFRRTGSYEALPQGGDRHSHRIEEHADAIIAWVEETPGTTIMGIVEWLEEEFGFKSSYGAVWNFLNRHGISYKKKPRSPVRSSAPTGCSTTCGG